MKKVFFILLFVTPLFISSSCKKDKENVDPKEPEVETITHNGLVYKTVVNPATGKKWLDRNLGASQVATSSTDEASFGDLYQWGRGTDGHEKRDSDITTELSSTDSPGHGDFILPPENDPWDWLSPQNDNLWDGVDGINNPCPSGFRLPTSDELDAELASWKTNDAEGAFNSPLKLPLAGKRATPYDGDVVGVGERGNIWGTAHNSYGGHITFRSENTGSFYSGRGYGYSVRCIKD